MKSKFINNLKEKAKRTATNLQNEKINNNYDSKFKVPEECKEKLYKEESKGESQKYHEEDPFNDDLKSNNYEDDEYRLPIAQKPESFHRFILENDFRTLERQIRGLKDVWDKQQGKYITKRKDSHCFTDEESESILRLCETHLSSGIKLSIMTREQYDIKLMGLYQQIETHFREIMEYKFGRFEGFDIQLQMKRDAINIFSSIMFNVFANYSRAVEGRENKATHDSVKAQESLNTPLETRQDFGYT